MKLTAPYLKHFSLVVNPFDKDCDPRFVWLGEKQLETLAYLKVGIEENRGLLLLTGDQGSGKSLFIDCIQRMLDFNTMVALLNDPAMAMNDLFRFLLTEFNIDKQFKNKGSFLSAFKNFLSESYRNKRKVLLIVDNAHKLSHEFLEQLRLLSNIEEGNTKLMTILFVGRQAINKALQEYRNRAFLQRLTIRCQLEPLGENETHNYIQHRLKAAGGVQKIFTADAVQEIHLYSSGYPHQINIICDHVLMKAHFKGDRTIDADIIRENAGEVLKSLNIPLPPLTKRLSARRKKSKSARPRKLRRTLGIALLVALCVFAVSPAGYELMGMLPQLITKISPFTLQKEVIHFKQGSLEIPSESTAILNNLAETLSQNPETGIALKGYTDSSGKHDSNIRISRIRAEKVKKYLVQKGVDPSRIEVNGLGPQNPVAANDTPDGRDKNRRVEIEVKLKNK